ncbi:hypothetical protein [Dapis sp. BLCC M126]
MRDCFGGLVDLTTKVTVANSPRNDNFLLVCHCEERLRSIP